MTDPVIRSRKALTEEQLETLRAALAMLEAVEFVCGRDVARAMGLSAKKSHVITGHLFALHRRGLLQRVENRFYKADYAAAQPKPKATAAAPSTNSFIRPIPKARLMAGRA